MRHVLEVAGICRAEIPQQPRAVVRGRPAVIGSHHVQISVAVVVAEGDAFAAAIERAAAHRNVGPARQGLLGEMAVPVVDVQIMSRRFAPHHVQVQIAIVVDVAGRRTVGRQRLREAGRGGHVLEAATGVAVKHVGSIDPREEEIDQAVAIEVAGRRAAGHGLCAGRSRLHVVDSQRCRDVRKGDRRRRRRVAPQDCGDQSQSQDRCSRMANHRRNLGRCNSAIADKHKPASKALAGSGTGSPEK